MGCYIQYEKCSSIANKQNIDKDKYAEGSGEEDVIGGDDNKDNDKSKDGIRVDEDSNLDDDLQEKIEIENRSVKPDDDNDQGTEGSGVDKSEGIEIEEDPSENVKLEDLMDSTNDENEGNMDGKNDTEKNEENLNKSKENKYGEDSGHSSVEEGNDNKKSEPFCTEGITSEKECKETATKWCKSRHCENGFVGKCQYKSKENSCCKKYRCKKHDKAQQNDVGSKLGPGETIVHYSFHGNDKLSKILRPHHCNRTNICPALVDKGICDNSVLGCETEFSCEDDNCKCIVITS